MSTKTLIQSVLTCITALIALLAVSFAWFAISKEANTGLVGQVGDMETIFDLDQVVEGEDGNDQWGNANDGFLNKKDIMPGSAFTFRLAVLNKSDSTGTISVQMTGAKSYYVTEVHDDEHGDYELSDVYADDALFTKIQYAFSLKILNCYWVSYDQAEKPIDIDQNDPLPKPDNTDYVEFTDGTPDSDKEKYFATYDVGTIDVPRMVRIDKENVYFNKFKKSLQDGQNIYTDDTNYDLVHNITLNSEKLGHDSPDYHNAFVIFFSIEFNSDAIVPEYISYNEADLTSEVYENQLFGFDSVTVITQKDK